MNGHLEMVAAPNPPIHALVKLLQRLNENEEFAHVIRSELKDVGFGIRMRPWLTPSNEHVVYSSILWMTWGKLVRKIDAPKSRWQAVRALLGLSHDRMVRSIVQISTADKRPEGFGLLHWYQSVSVRLDELETVPNIVQTKLAIALASARMIMTRRPERIQYSRSLVTPLVTEVIPAPHESVSHVDGEKGEWTNVLLGPAPIQETDIERISWVV